MARAALTVGDVAAYLAVAEKTVYRLAQRRVLPGFKVAGAWRFRPEDIEDWIQQQKAAGSPDESTRGPAGSQDARRRGVASGRGSRGDAR